MSSIKDSPGRVSDDGLKSQTLYIRGVTKTCTFDDMVEKISVVAPPYETLVESSNAHIWAKYESIAVAEETIDRLHQLYWRGKYLAVKYELGLDSSNQRIPSKYPGNKFIVRHVGRADGSGEAATGTDTTNPAPNASSSAPEAESKPKKKKGKAGSCAPPPVTYNSRSLSVGDVEYPFPTGVYSARVLAEVSAALAATTDQSPHARPHPLLHVLTDQSGYARTHMYTKEMSEAMAMVDGLQRALNLLKATPEQLRERGVRIFCLGDGASCLCGAAISVFHPALGAEIFSIDPILLEGPAAAESALEVDDSGNKFMPLPLPQSPSCTGDTDTDAAAVLASFHRVPMMSQEFTIPAPRASSTGSTAAAVDRQGPLEVVIACHSHAPLEEFWERLPCYAGLCDPGSRSGSGPHAWSKLAVSLNCCAQYCMLPALVPVMQYDDFEVYSPKRTIRLYAQ